MEKIKERIKMTVSNKRLPQSISKHSKNEYISKDVLVKVCTALGVDYKDIMKLVPNMVEEREQSYGE